MITIIAFSNLYCAPYIGIYEDILKKENCGYKVYYLDRENINEDSANVSQGMRWKRLKWLPHLEKLYNFWRYKTYIKKRLSEDSSQIVIVLTTMPAVMLSGYLVKKYRRRFIMDIRDYTYEKYGIYHRIEEKTINAAAMVSISSEGFRNFLPQYDYVVSHNVRHDRLYKAITENRAWRKSDGQIVIGYVGTIAYPKPVIALTELVAKDKRFSFLLYGREANHVVSNFINGLDADNIQMMGKYSPDEKEKTYEQIDIIFNAYGFASPLLDYAISNKYYDALIMKKPILNSPGTAMHKLLEPISYVFDHTKEQTLDGLYSWYQELDETLSSDFCQNRLAELLSDCETFYDRVSGEIQNAKERTINA